jgi:hypothetical protein
MVIRSVGGGGAGSVGGICGEGFEAKEMRAYTLHACNTCLVMALPDHGL